jgi:hypothetical protein
MIQQAPLECHLFKANDCCFDCHASEDRPYQLIRPPRGGLRSAMIEYVAVCCLVHSKITSITIVEQI